MAVAAQIVEVVGLRRCADAHAGLSAWHVVEAVTIQTANLHVLDRFGLDGKIGGLRPSNRSHTCCRAEEKTFHHLHLNLQVSLSEDFRICRASLWCFVSAALDSRTAPTARLVILRTPGRKEKR